MEFNSFALFVLVGFCAQLIDGSLGMGYGVSANSFLLLFGVPPALASASIHTAEVFTAGVSGLSHWKLGNVDMRLFKRLSLSGVAGAVVGAYILIQIPGDSLKPYVAVYLMLMGALIIYKAFYRPQPREVTSHILPLGLVGGFFDAIGGGGWGPIVASNLIARGNHIRKSIGSVNLAEFFVALSVSLTLFGAVNLQTQLVNIAGLIVGGVVAAPLAAYLCSRIPVRALMGLTGMMIVALSLRNLL
jgi:uncharacterized membrane protein YfcA